MFEPPFENKGSVSCQTSQESPPSVRWRGSTAAYKRFEQGLLKFGTDVEEKILEVKSFEHMLKNFSIGKVYERLR